MVEDKKGEHLSVLAALRAQGYLRARVNREVWELDDVPELDRYRRHTIEAVIDRFRIRDDLRLRLAESLETALGIGDGRARLVSMDESATAELIFSARFALSRVWLCPARARAPFVLVQQPRRSLSRLRRFGGEIFFDPERIVIHPELSLPGGAIRGWDAA